ncbi:hypothetical protein [Niabella hibiscisoli]|uniref:hypothetical protein n=1 Tax=Niabella hibiscisoli TaxID=1825928 RepID=UPI001F0D50F2|nr:hypothetical protein [Niabella hibiscisoli]MCH5718109.1 hypothetical protein [Niabella hibiscisoli]
MFAKRIGVDPSNVKDSGTFVVVGGDMLFEKRQLLTTHPRQVVASTDDSAPMYGYGPISLEKEAI